MMPLWVAERVDRAVGCSFRCNRNLAVHGKCNQIRGKCIAPKLALENIKLWNYLPTARFCV